MLLREYLGELGCVDLSTYNLYYSPACDLL